MNESTFTIFGYTPPELSKSIISFISVAFAAIALFAGGSIFGFTISADFEAKVIALIPAALGVIAVFGIKNATFDAIDKAVMQLVTSGISVANFFAQVPSDLGVKIGAVVYAILTAYFIWRKSNSPLRA